MDPETRPLMTFVNVLGVTVFVLIAVFHWIQAASKPRAKSA